MTQTKNFPWKEIETDQALRGFGFFLCLSHIASYIYFVRENNYFLEVIFSRFRIPWPWISFDLSLAATQSQKTYIVLMSAYLGLALAGCVSFLFRRFYWAGYLCLCLLIAIKSFFIAHDYRFMGNYHYMVFWVHAAYLLLPFKKEALAWLLVLFYFSAGTLKLNPEWLSGQALLRPFPFSPKLTEWACVLAIGLELVCSFGLLAKSRKVFWSSFFLFISFHVISYYVVGYFYPVIMFCLLSFFVLTRIFGPELRPFDWKEMPKSTVVFLLGFIAFQLPPYLYAGDSALTGKGRLFSLNMLDAYSECDVFTYQKFRNKTVEVPRKNSQIGPRIHCDPIVVLSEARTYCMGVDPNFINVDVALVSKRRTDRNYQKILVENDICKK